jgi:hypothetical protein
MGDIGCYGGLAPTPRIDALADEGLALNKVGVRAVFRTDRVIRSSVGWSSVVLYSWLAWRLRKQPVTSMSASTKSVRREMSECVVVESTVHESILYSESVDQAKLQAVLGWLYSRGIEILSVLPDDDDVDSVDAPSSQLPGSKAR